VLRRRRLIGWTPLPAGYVTGNATADVASACGI
jgi:hypothetical protein